MQAEVAKDSVAPNHLYFIRLVSNKVAIKRIPAETAFKDSYHAKQVYREIAMLKQVMFMCTPCFFFSFSTEEMPEIWL